MISKGRRLATTAVVVLALTGCGSASPPSPPAGVDGLVIPTPSPDPADFVARISNPWLPLAIGSQWTYEASGSSRTIRLTVMPGPQIAGVRTTALRSSTANPVGRMVAEAVDYYAQDQEGNVWWFGHGGDDATWRADEGGAQAGLAMPATPRVGDGYRDALAPGAVQPRSRVKDLDAEADVPAGEYDGVLLVETMWPEQSGEPDQVVVSAYARGIGLVRRTGPDMELGLVEHDEPQPQ